MRRRRLYRGLLLLAILLVVGLCAFPRPLTILYTNDLHLRFERLESIQSMVETERGLGDPVLLLDAGDALQDFRTPLAAVHGADEMVAWMNRVGYDAMALGNHEMYWASDRLDELLAQARFPVLCSNLMAAPGFTASFVPATTLEVGGMRVLLIGVVTGSLLPYPDFPWLTYVDPAEAMRGVVDELAEPVDFIVAVGHVSIETAIGIARAVPEIDVFVTGHSHEETPNPTRAGGTLIVQAGAFAKRLGRLRLDVADGAAIVVTNELLPTEKTSVDSDRGLRMLAAVGLALLAATFLVIL